MIGLSCQNHCRFRRSSIATRPKFGRTEQERLRGQELQMVQGPRRDYGNVQRPSAWIEQVKMIVRVRDGEALSQRIDGDGSGFVPDELCVADRQIPVQPEHVAATVRNNEGGTVVGSGRAGDRGGPAAPDPGSDPARLSKTSQRFASQASTWPDSGAMAMPAAGPESRCVQRGDGMMEVSLRRQRIASIRAACSRAASNW